MKQLPLLFAWFFFPLVLLAQAAHPRRKPTAYRPPSSPTAVLTEAPAATPTPSWSKEPNSFRGVAFGSTEKETVRILGNILDHGSGYQGCLDAKSVASLAKRVCSWKFKIGDANVASYLSFYQDRLVLVYLDFPVEQYGGVRDVFVEKYGPPTQVASPMGKTRMGVEFQNEDLRWDGKALLVSLHKYAGNVTTSSATFVLLSFAAEDDAAGIEKKKKAAEAF